MCKHFVSFLQVHSENGPSLSYPLCWQIVTILTGIRSNDSGKTRWKLYFPLNASPSAWLNNCVGHFNHRYFFSFCLFMTLGCVYCSISGRNLFLDAYNALEVSSTACCNAGLLCASGFMHYCGGLPVFNAGLCFWGLSRQRFKHLDVEKPGVPVTGMGALIGLVPTGQVLTQKHLFPLRDLVPI